MNNIKYIECNTLERFNEVTDKIVAFEDERTCGEYSRTGTQYIYPVPTESEENAYPFYFPVESKWFALFTPEEMIDEIPQPEIFDEEE